MTDLALMKLHIDVLYQKNHKGALTVINEPPFETAPTVMVGATKEGKVVYFSEEVDDLFKKRVQQIVKETKDEMIAQIINKMTRRTNLSEFNMGPTYVFPEIKEKSPKVLHIKEIDKEVLAADFPFIQSDFEVKEPCMIVMEHDRVVSLCCTARHSNEAAEASVFTHEKYRGKGYGAAVTEAWAMAIQQQGKTALYSTTWDNFASQGVAKKLGMRQYGFELAIE